MGEGKQKKKRLGDERQKRLAERAEWGVREAEMQNKREMRINGRIPGVEKELMMMMCQCREDLALLAAKESALSLTRSSDVF